MGWILLEQDDGTLKACEEASPDPRTVYPFATIQEGIDYCDEQVAESWEWWNRNPENQKDGEVVQPELLEIPESWPRSAKESCERFNDDVNRHNAELEKWNSLKSELEAKL